MNRWEQNRQPAEFGLIGEHLGHSFSPLIHRELGGYDYSLIELAPEELGDFLNNGAFRGINVTIPYKQAVIPYLRRLTPRAEAIGSVNTVLRQADGSLLGDNTDYAGFLAMMHGADITPVGKKCLVLGSGGASRTAAACLRAEGARETVIISRQGENNYTNLGRHSDAEIVVNTTPVGMYPGNGASPVNLDAFPALEGVLDLIYNPARTALLLQAEERGIPFAGGLLMLTAQGKAAAELFLGRPLPEAETERVYRLLRRRTENLVLIGMPGSGKTTVGRILAEKTGRKFLDTDEMLAERSGLSCGDYLRRYGEKAFRCLETQAVRDAGKETGCVIATGGGVVTRAENRNLLRQNGCLIHLDRPPEELGTGGDRPLSASRELLEQRYRERAPLYAAWRDLRAAGTSAADTAEQILKWEEENR